MFLLGSLYKDLDPIGLMASNAPLVAIVSDTTTVGAIIDTEKSDRTLLALFTKIVTDGDYDHQLFHGDDAAMADEAEVLASDLNGTLPNYVADTDDDKVATVEYIGRKRYIRLKIVSTNVTTGVDAIGGAALINKMKKPSQT